MSPTQELRQQALAAFHAAPPTAQVAARRAFAQDSAALAWWLTHNLDELNRLIRAAPTRETVINPEDTYFTG